MCNISRNLECVELILLGSLGIPRIPWLEKLGLQKQSVKEYAFYDTSLGNCIEHAFHALALDERRASFQPTIWEKSRTNTTVSSTCIGTFNLSDSANNIGP